MPNRERIDFLTEEYNQLICSACPFSEGVEEYIEVDGGSIPCSLWNGSLYRLDEPYKCIIADRNIGGRTITSEDLHVMMIIKAGPEGYENFLNKQRILFLIEAIK